MYIYPGMHRGDESAEQFERPEPFMTKDQAEKKILTLKKDLFNIRFKKVNNQINNPAQYNEIKKSIARLYTTIKNLK